MPRVVPSQVFYAIAAIPLTQTPTGIVRMNSVGSAALSAVLDLVEQIPDELLIMDSGTYLSFVTGKAEIRDILATWKANQTAGQPLQRFDMHVSANPLARIRDALAK